MLCALLFLLAIPLGLYAGLPHQNSEEFQAAALESLSLETYTTWTPDGTIPQVFSVTIEDHMDRLLADKSGRLWLVQNEPERLSSANGSETAATVVAAALQGVEQSFACCGVMINEAGLQWLDEYLEAGGPIPDAWHIHIYQTWSGGWTYAAAQFKFWMEEHGVERPVIVSETSAAHAPISSQLEVMNTAYDMMNSNDWLQTVIWFSVHHSCVESTWTQAQLVDASGQRTMLGDRFVQLRSQQAQDTSPTPTATPSPHPTDTSALTPTATSQPESQTPSPGPGVAPTQAPSATPVPSATSSPESTSTTADPPSSTPDVVTTITVTTPTAIATVEATATPKPTVISIVPTLPPFPDSDSPSGGRPDAVPKGTDPTGSRRIFLPSIANSIGW